MVRDGYIYGLSLLAVAVVMRWATDSWIWSVLPILLAIFFFWFFRDPKRDIPAGDGLVVSPADGLVTETVRFETSDGPRQRISIFLNVFDVHVNRSPIAGEVTAVRYQTGKFLNAMKQECAERNEQNIVTVQGEGIEVVFKQIAGLIARRIVFDPRVGDRVDRGQRVGLIKFGSRTDLILPAEAEIRVRVGQRVKGGSSIVAEMPEWSAMAGVAVPVKRASASVDPEPDDGELA